MVRLFRGTLLLMAVFAMAIVGMCLIGRRDPRPTLMYLFTNPDGSFCQQPCLFGARPGRMTAPQMVAVMRTHPITRTMAPFPNAIAYGGFEGQGMVIFVGTIGGGVRLGISNAPDRPSELPLVSDWLFQDGPISLDGVITAFGLPDAGLISSSDSVPTIGAIYAGQRTQFIFKCVPADRISPDALLTEIDIWPDNFPLTFAGSAAWMGYGPVDRYPTRP